MPPSSTRWSAAPLAPPTDSATPRLWRPRFKYLHLRYSPQPGAHRAWHSIGEIPCTHALAEVRVMLFSPPVLPFSLLLGLLSFAVLGGGIYLIWAWFAGVVVGTAYLVGGLAMFAFTFLGRPLVLMLRRR